jgi:hypothetical protein
MPEPAKRVEKTWIPKVPASEIRTRAAHIRPVVSFPIIGNCYIWNVDLFQEAFTRGAWPKRPALGLKWVHNIRTYHVCQEDDIFRPSVAEVLAQIPFEYLNKTKAFRVVEVTHDADACVAGYHTALTSLYTTW